MTLISVCRGGLVRRYRVAESTAAVRRQIRDAREAQRVLDKLTYGGAVDDARS